MIFALGNMGDFPSIVLNIVFVFLAVCIALIPHEVAHGLVAKWNGDYTAKYAGRLTLNPLKHFDLIGFLMMMLCGFGYAKPVPVNPSNFKNYRRGLFTVAIAGVVVNLLIAFFSALIWCLLILGFNRADAYGAQMTLMYLAQFFSLVVSINLSLVFFNLLPIFPLDGFRVVEAVTHSGNRYVRFMRANGHYFLFGLVGLSFIISMAFNYAPYLPYWFEYFDILGTYIQFFVSHVSSWFTSFWWLMVPLI